MHGISRVFLGKTTAHALGISGSSGTSGALIESIPNPNVSLETVKRSRTFKKSSDVVAQCVHLSRVSSDPVLWQSTADTVTRSVALLKGQDIASVLRSASNVNFRDPLMLAAICESLKTLPRLRVLRVTDIASIVNSFHRLNFVPSVEVLNGISEEILRSVPLYRTRGTDLCYLLRYFSVLSARPDLVIDYQEGFRFPQVRSMLEDQVKLRMGKFGPAEIAVITKHVRNISLESLILNFTRSDNVKPQLEEFFKRQLDTRFGTDSWRQYHYLFKQRFVDNTGWGRKAPEDDLDPFTASSPVEAAEQKKLPLFRLDDILVQATLDAVPHHSSGGRRKARETGPAKSPAVSLSDEQMEFLRLLEEELSETEPALPKPPSAKPFNERVDRKLVRDIEMSDIRGEASAPTELSAKKFKQWRNRRLFRFATLSVLRSADSP